MSNASAMSPKNANRVTEKSKLERKNKINVGAVIYQQCFSRGEGLVLLQPNKVHEARGRRVVRAG